METEGEPGCPNRVRKDVQDNPFAVYERSYRVLSMHPKIRTSQYIEKFAKVLQCSKHLKSDFTKHFLLDPGCPAKPREDDEREILNEYEDGKIDDDEYLTGDELYQNNGEYLARKVEKYLGHPRVSGNHNITTIESKLKK